MTSDGMRVFVDGEIVIDAWETQEPTTHTVKEELAGGQHEIVVEYFEHDGGAVAQLEFFPINRFEDTEFAFPSNWKESSASSYSGGTARYTNSDAHAAEFEFDGPRVRWIGPRYSGGAIARVFVDGVDQGTVDTYSAKRQKQQTLFEAEGLSDGPHTLSIVYEGRNPSAPSWAIVVVDAVDTRSLV